jgi:hypothetical protein
MEQWVLAASRWSRPGGVAVLSGTDGAAGPSRVRPDVMRRWASRCADPGLDRLARDWFPTRDADRRDGGGGRGPSHSPPVASMGVLDASLAVLRPGWDDAGDLLAVDHRDLAAGGTRLHLLARDRGVLAGLWPSRIGGPSRPVRWHAGVGGEIYEWAIGPKSGASLRSALLLADRGLAILAEQTPAGAAAALELPLAPGVTAEPDGPAGYGVVRLRLARGATAIALSIDPATPLDLNRDGRIGIAPATDANAGRSWRAVVLAWGDALTRRPPIVRPLTVTERGRVCRPSVARAVRLGWASESLVIYRGLGPPGQRAVLGHPTTSRFLIGRFDREGRVEPIVRVD